MSWMWTMVTERDQRVKSGDVVLIDYAVKML